MRSFARLIRDERAATAIEYGLIASLIVIAMIASLTLFADTTMNMWTYVANTVMANA